jgi:hypothetical protein
MHTIDIDRAEPKTEVQVEQAQKAYGGPQAISCMDTNLLWIKASPGASHPILDFYF